MNSGGTTKLVIVPCSYITIWGVFLFQIIRGLLILEVKIDKNMEALMTTITKEQVAHIAHLSRLEIQENEVDGYIEKLEKVVELFDTINNAPTENVKPTYHVLDLVNVFREDVAKPGMDREEVLKNAHETEAGQFKVPTIIE